jgi:plastocyanin
MNTRTALMLATALAVSVVPLSSRAKTWQASAGFQSLDEGIQVLGFIPNELWVHVGDSIMWTFPAGEIHTVTFLKPGQVRPPRPNAPGVVGGCPGTTSDDSSFDGSACLTSVELLDGLYREFSDRRELQSRLPGACQHDRTGLCPRTIRGASLSADLL